MILCIAVTAGFKNQSQIGNAYGEMVVFLVIHYLGSNSCSKILANQYIYFFFDLATYRNCSCYSYASNHTAHDAHNVVSLALPLDSYTGFHYIISSGGMYLLLCRAFQSRSRWLGAIGDCRCLSSHHVCLAFW